MHTESTNILIMLILVVQLTQIISIHGAFTISQIGTTISPLHALDHLMPKIISKVG